MKTQKLCGFQMYFLCAMVFFCLNNFELPASSYLKHNGTQTPSITKHIYIILIGFAKYDLEETQLVPEEVEVGGWAYKDRF